MSRNVYTRREFLKAVGVTTAAAAVGSCTGSARFPGKASAQRPNFVIIFCDDLGYGDLGCFGSRKHRTPNVDRLAGEGMRLTSFYAAAVCTPSRASLMTGCYPLRVNMHQDHQGLCVLFPVSKKGLNPDEITIAEILRSRGYATACIGKWHLGDQRPFLPRRQGFDYYYGIPYSNDMGAAQGPHQPPLPLLRNEEVIEAPADQDLLTSRYTDEAIRFIRANKDRPFFLYLAHTMPHNPVHAGEAFRGKSKNGIYGDAVEEIDWSTGRLLATLKALGLDGNTLVIFTSDNGAASDFGGSNGPLRGFKGSTWEGGVRVPCIARWPGRIPPRSACDDVTSTMDLLVTFAYLAGTNAPTDRIIDGKNIWPLLSGRKDPTAGQRVFYYYQKDQLQAVRCGKWKLHLELKPKKRHWGKPEPFSPLQLYDLEADIGETNNVAGQHPEVVARLTALAEKAREDIGDVGRAGAGQRPAGFVEHPKPLVMSK